MDKTKLEQVQKQCEAVAHLARRLATCYEQYGPLLREQEADILDLVGSRTAEFMEMLGNALNATDSWEPEDAQFDAVFADAQRLWPMSPNA